MCIPQLDVVNNDATRLRLLPDSVIHDMEPFPYRVRRCPVREPTPSQRVNYRGMRHPCFGGENGLGWTGCQVGTRMPRRPAALQEMGGSPACDRPRTTVRTSIGHKTHSAA